MSTAQVANSGIVGAAARAAQPRYVPASSTGYVDAAAGAFGPPPYDQTPVFDADQDYFAAPRRRRSQGGPFQDRVVSFGGVLVSQEVGTAIMQAQAHAALEALPHGVEAQRRIKVYEFNQSLMGATQVTTDVGIMR